jgi:hypothetical protein
MDIDDLALLESFAGKRPRYVAYPLAFSTFSPARPDGTSYRLLTLYPRWSPLTKPVLEVLRTNFGKIPATKSVSTLSSMVKKILLPLQEMQQFASGRLIRCAPDPHVNVSRASCLSHCDYKTANLLLDGKEKHFRICAWHISSHS